MDALDPYSLPISGLRMGIHEYRFNVDRGFFSQFEDSPVEDGDVDVEVILDKRPDFFVLDFELSGTVKVTCDRCLEAFDLPISDSQRLYVKFDETEWEDVDVVYVLQGTQQFNVARFIYEFINLAMPISRTHEEAGETCNPEMLKYLKSSEESPGPESGSVWDSLKGLNFDN
ncbi:MAG: hypothetical protein RI973_1735 [Bacteroidota bacterium]|jgi:uncharacterized protein